MGEPLELGNAVEAVLEMTLQPDPEGAAGVPAGTREAA
jgi:hypothetical protein